MHTPQAKGFGKERFVGLEWLRFVLALYLVIHHTLFMYPDFEQYFGVREFAALGFFATTAFFALSGFLLTHVYLVGDRLREPASSLWAKRFANLYPVHLLGLGAAIGLVLLTGLFDENASLHVGYHANEYLLRHAPQELEYRMTDGELALNLFLQITALQAWNPWFLAYNGALWSISALFFFYLTFPWVAPRLARVKQKWRLLLLVCLLSLAPAVAITLTGQYSIGWMGALHHVPVFRWMPFVAGIVTCLLFRQYQQRGRLFSPRQRVALWALLGMALTAAAWLNLHGGQAWYLLLHSGLLLPFALILIVLCALRPVPGESSRRWAVRLGAASLSIFALHLPLFAVFRRLEALLAVNIWRCLDDAGACVARALRYELEILYYPLLLTLLVGICVLVQERLVAPARRWCLANPLRRFVQPGVAKAPPADRAPGCLGLGAGDARQ